MDDRVVAVRIGGERAGNEVAVGVEAFAPSCAPVLYLRFSRPEPAQHVAARVEDGRGRAGQELVRVDAVLMRVNQRGHLFEQRSADGFLAFRVLGPVRARRQRALSARCRKLSSPTELQDGACESVSTIMQSVFTICSNSMCITGAAWVDRRWLRSRATMRSLRISGSKSQPAMRASPSAAQRWCDCSMTSARSGASGGPRRPQRARRAGWLPRGASGSSRRLVL